MLLFTKDIQQKLTENGKASEAAILDDGNTANVKPVVKLFTPWAGCTWLLTELEWSEGEPTGRAYGLCDLGMGFPEIGYVDMNELRETRGPFGLRIERDRNWTATKTLSEYADEAREKVRIAA